MLEFQVVEYLKPNNEMIEMLKDKFTYKVKNRKIKTLTNTNLQFGTIKV